MSAPPAAHSRHPPSDHVPNEEIQDETQPPQNNATTDPEIEAAQQAQTQSPPTNVATASETAAVAPGAQNEELPRIDPRLLRAVAHGDVVSFKRILKIEFGWSNDLIFPSMPIFITRMCRFTLLSFPGGRPADILGINFQSIKKNILAAVIWFNIIIRGGVQSIKKNILDAVIWFNIIIRGRGPVEQNGNANIAPTQPDPEASGAQVSEAQNVLQGVTYGKNNAFHIVAGVMEPPPPKIYAYLLQGLFIICQCYLIIYFPLSVPLLIIFHNNMEQDLEIAEIIYRKHPILLRARNHAKETPLLCAARAGNHKMVALFIKLINESNSQNLEEMLWARDSLGETALHAAARPDYSYVVKVLVGADETLAHELDDNGASPLYLAAASGSLNVVRVLTGCNRPVSHLGPNGQTALHAAVMRQGYNGRTIIDEILKWKPDLATTPDEKKNTPLHYAASIGNGYAVRKILSENPEAAYAPNDVLGSFPVHHAADIGSFEVINEILKKCPDVGELLDQNKRNFLHIAVEKKRESLVVLAIRKGILNGNMINARDKDGNTPLHIAVKSSNLGIFTLLFRDSRVNPNIKNEEDLTPLDISASLQDNQYTYSLNPQSIIHHTLLTSGAFRNPCQPVSSRIAGNPIPMTKDNGAQADCGEKETSNTVGTDIEKEESTKYENMSKSLITGAVLIASAAFLAIFTVSGVYKGNKASHTLTSIFKAFVIADVFAFIFATVSTTWLLHSALTKIHLKYRKFYFRWSIRFLNMAINIFILTFGIGGYIAIEPLPHCKWFAVFILVISGVAVLCNIIFNPKFLPRILQAPYYTVEVDLMTW